jgi:ATP-dependent DNA helicase RecG
VWDDGLSIWSPGTLPGDLTADQLYQSGHPSILRNPLIAQVFYYAGLIERWGSGTTRILDLCAEQELPVPTFEESSGGVRVTFYQAYTPATLREKGLSERQITAALYVKAHGQITNTVYQELTGVSKATATRDLEALVQMGVLNREGAGRGTHYRLIRLINGS